MAIAFRAQGPHRTVCHRPRTAVHDAFSGFDFRAPTRVGRYWVETWSGGLVQDEFMDVY